MEYAGILARLAHTAHAFLMRALQPPPGQQVQACARACMHAWLPAVSSLPGMTCHRSCTSVVIITNEHRKTLPA